LGYFKIELIHQNGVKYWTEWDIEGYEDYSKNEYINMITGNSVGEMTSISIFNMCDIELDYEEAESIKKCLSWGKVLDIEMN
jgi:thymidylate synthase